MNPISLSSTQPHVLRFGKLSVKEPVVEGSVGELKLQDPVSIDDALDEELKAIDGSYKFYRTVLGAELDKFVSKNKDAKWHDGLDIGVATLLSRNEQFGENYIRITVGDDKDSEIGRIGLFPSWSEWSATQKRISLR